MPGKSFGKSAKLWSPKKEKSGVGREGAEEKTDIFIIKVDHLTIHIGQMQSSKIDKQSKDCKIKRLL